jgi:hypothetical protein
MVSKYWLAPALPGGTTSAANGSPPIGISLGVSENNGELGFSDRARR